MRFGALGLIFVSLLVAGLQATPAGAAGGPTLNQPTVTCQTARATVTFAWRPVPGSSEQWIDLTTADNNFAPGTYISSGPFNGSTTSYVWDGLTGGVTHFWRVTSKGADGWVASDPGTLTPCAATASGVSFVFGTNVSESERTAIRSYIQFARDFGRGLFNFDASTFTVSAYQDVGEFAEAIANWFEDPSPGTIQAIRNSYSNTRTAGITGYGDGIFIPTWTDSWTRSNANFRLFLLSHEYFHVIQGTLDQGWSHSTPESMRNVGHWGSPTWINEGSAEYFGLQAYASKAGIDFATVRASYVRQVASSSLSLIAIETSSRFGAKADESYPLGMLAIEYLVKDKGMPALIDYYTRLGNKEQWQSAFSSAFGVSYTSFVGAFDQYRANGFK